MDLVPSSPLTTLQTVKERMRGKINGALKTVKLQTSLAAKIKTKTLNSSSFLKVSLKHNNKALACALSAERQKSRKLENDKMFLQKEAKMLNFQNALLRQNLSIVNNILKDIDLFMNVNLPTAIEISSTMEPSDLSLDGRKSDRFSHQSAGSRDAYQGFRLTGMALRVPSSSVEQPIHSVPAEIPSEGHPIMASPSTNSRMVRERSDQQPETEPYSVASKDSLPPFSENTSQGDVSNASVGDPVILLDDDLCSYNRGAQSDRFVTIRKKRSTVSHSSTRTVRSDLNHSKSSTGSSRESGRSVQWELDTPTPVLPDSGHPGFGGETASHFDLVKGRNWISITSRSISPLETTGPDQDCDLQKESSSSPPAEPVPAATDQPAHVHPAVDGCVAQEKTVYEADMEMTSSDSAAIVAVASTNKAHSLKSRSNIPIKQDGTSLRKVRQSVREKKKKKDLPCEQKKGKPTGSQQMTEAAVESAGNVNLENKFPVNLNPSPSLLSDQCDYRRTYVLPGPVKPKIIDCFESAPNSEPIIDTATPTEPAGQEQSDNITTSHSETNKLTSILKNKPCADLGHNTTEAAPIAKRKSNSRKRASKTMERSPKKKRKINTCSRDREHVGEEVGNINEASEQLDQNITHIVIPDFSVKETQIRRETYVVSSANPFIVTTEFKSSKDRKTNSRRATFIIPKPNPLASIANKTLDSVEKAETYSEEKTDSKYASDPGSDKPDNHKLATLSKCPEKKARLRKKTLIAPAKEDDTGLDKGTLVRESTVHLSGQTNKPTKMLNAIMTNMRDSLMIDMVSESILDDTLEGSSLVEFPSSTNPESTFTVGGFSTSPPSELSEPENCNPKDLTHASKIFNVLDESHNCEARGSLETGSNPQRRAEKQSMEIQEPAIKPLQDLTNKVCVSKKKPKACSEEEEDDGDYSSARRRRKAVSYAEPKLNKKMRR